MAAQPGRWARWHFGLLATALLLTAGGLLSVGLWRDPPPAATSENPPAKTLPVEFDIRQISKQDSGFLVQLRVRNLGSERIANLRIEGQLYVGPTRLERSVGQLEMMPPKGIRQVQLFFVNDPRHHQVRFLAQGDGAQHLSSAPTTGATPSAGLLNVL